MTVLDSFGLSPREILLLQYAEGYTTSTNDFQQFWEWKYNLNDPQKKLSELAERGFLKIGGVESAVTTKTGTTLKTLLREHGLKVSGRKNDLIDRVLDSIPHDEIRTRFPEQWYLRTEKGDQALQDSPHVPYIHSSQFIPDLDINSLAELVSTYPGHRWRDLIWEHLNRQTLVHAQAGKWGLYRNAKLAMARFIAEESRWHDAIGLLAEVIFYDLSGLDNGFDPAYFSKKVEYLFPYEQSVATIPPGVREWIFEYAERAELNEEELREIVSEKLQRLSAPMQLFTTEEIVQILFLEKESKSMELTELYKIAEERIRRS